MIIGFTKFSFVLFLLLLLPLVSVALLPVHVARLPEKSSEIARHLDNIENKIQANKELTTDELWFLYEVKYPIGRNNTAEGEYYYGINPQVRKIRESRDFKKDLARIHNVEPSEVSKSIWETTEKSQIKVFYGTLRHSSDDFDSSLLKHLIAIHGDLRTDLTNSQHLSSLTYIGGNADFSKLRGG